MKHWFSNIGCSLVFIVLASTLFAGKPVQIQSQETEKAVIPHEVQKTIQLRKQIGMHYLKEVMVPRQQVLQRGSREADMPEDLRLRKQQLKSREAVRSVNRRDHPLPRATEWSAGEQYMAQTLVSNTVSTLGLTINNVQADTVEVGTGAVLRFSFPTGETEALAQIIFDINEDGVLDPGDLYIDMGESMVLIDNDYMDSDTTDGVYELVMDPDFGEGLFYAQGGLFFEVSSGIEAESVFLYQMGYDTGYSVSGLIEDETATGLQGIIVIAEWQDTGTGEYRAIMDLTDVSGYYSIGLPEAVTVWLFSADYLMQTGGMFPEPTHYEDVIVDGAVTGYDFTYLFGTSVIRGVVTDNQLNPVSGVRIWVEGDFEAGFFAETDSAGFYQLQVPAGWFDVGIDAETVVPNYLAAADTFIEVWEADTTEVNFTVFAANAQITGNVTWDGAPAAGIFVNAWNEDIGYTWTETDGSGNYSLPVYNSLHDSTFYWVFVDDWEIEGAIIEPDGYWVPAYSTGNDFTITSVTGGITGFAINATTGDTIRGEDVWVWASQLDGDFWNDTGINWETGEFTLWLPPGFYEVGADADSFFSVYDSIEVSTELIPYNFYLDPIDFVGDIHGRVITSADSVTGIPYAWVDVWNDWYYFWTETDAQGNYQIDLPAGDFIVYIGADNYWGVDDSVSMSEGLSLERNYYLDEYGSFTGGLEGYVYDSATNAPLGNAEVAAGNDDYYDWTYTDESGYYSLNLPAGNYWVDAWAPDYYTFFDSVSIGETYVWRDYYLDYMGGEDFGEVYGVVRDTVTASPIEGAAVYLGSTDIMYTDMTFTDSNGEFYFGTVPYGWYNLLVEAPGYYDAYVMDFPVDESNQSQFFTFDLQPGAFESAFEGYVSTTDAFPVDYASVVAYNVSTEDVFITLSDESGNYFLPVENGTYSLMVEKSGFHPWFSMSDFDLLNDTVTVDVALQEYSGEGVPPQILGIMDVPEDQGRQVRIGFAPGTPGYEAVFTGWSVWRELMLPVGGVWEFVDYLPFHDMETYVLVAPTLVDSNAYTGPTDEFWSTFMVSGHTPDPYFYMDSPPMSGYSIDNLAPGVPTTVSGTADENGINLTWDGSPDHDFQYFTVYRGSAPGFDVSEATMVDHTAEPLYVDSPDQEYPVYYRITAVDVNGNESGHSDEVAIVGTGIDSNAGQPTEFALQQNYPNPFNPTTTLRYAIPEAGSVNITVYNILGQPISTLVRAQQEPGYYTVNWDGTDAYGQQVSSGMYFYKIQVTSGTDTRYQTVRKMMLMR